MDKNKEESINNIDEDVINPSEIEASTEGSTPSEPVVSPDIIEPAAQDVSPIVGTPIQPPKKANWFKRFIRTKKGKATLVFVAILLVGGILFAIPTTRYGILGNIIKKNVHVMIMDSITMKPVSQATITLGGKTAKTSKTGEVTLESMPVGEYSLKVTKSYYKTSETAYIVPVLGEMKQAHVSLVAAGRQVTVHVKNTIGGAMLAGATIVVNDTSAVTDDKGEATIVLPADKKTLKGTVKLDGYNESAIDVKVTDQPTANEFSITPSGTIYYLSKQTGKINVMKSQLDGSLSSVVVEGTGNESDSETVLLAARDWNYMALSAKRDSTNVQHLYVVDAKTGKLGVIDEGTDVSFQLVGWSDHRFIYVVNRSNKKQWEPQAQTLKSYNAETGKIAVLDETTAIGTSVFDYQQEYLGNPYILEGKIVYTKVWSQNTYTHIPSDKKSAIMAVNPDGTGKQRAKEFSMQRTIYIDAKLYEPQGVYFGVSADDETPTYYEYENGAVKSVSSTTEKFDAFYATYLVSPSSQKTFWSEPRDGKNALIVGDKDGKNGTTLDNQSDYTAYGWYSDKYVLLSKNKSELYIAPATEVFTDTHQPLKVTNYHKPSTQFPGYGYGYGGL